MAPFVAALETYHSLTKPSTWLESVVKAYVGTGWRPTSSARWPRSSTDETGNLIRDVLTDVGRAEFAVARSRRRLPSSRRWPGRLALWARRLVGEAISQTQHVSPTATR